MDKDIKRFKTRKNNEDAARADLPDLPADR